VAADRGDGTTPSITRLAELVSTGPAGPETNPQVVLGFAAESLDADAVIAGRMLDVLWIDHVADRRDLGLRAGEALTLHDQHFGARIATAHAGDATYAHYESLVLAGASGPRGAVSVPLFRRDGLAHGRLCALFRDAHPASDEALTLLRLAGRLYMDILSAREEHSTEDHWKYQALHDPLTGLPNRLLLRDRLQQALAIAHRDAHPLALMLLDLDGFKAVNDRFGHHSGDALLRQVGVRLRRPLRQSDTVARLGGDEFVILLPEVGQAGAIQVARKLLRALRHPFDLGEGSISMWGSIGVAIYPEDGTSPSELFEHADAAMYRAKRREGGYALAATGRTPLPMSLHKPHGRRS
jgi:diguanylate cyclase (GGDEF)-like protein